MARIVALLAVAVVAWLMSDKFPEAIQRLRAPKAPVACARDGGAP